VDWERAHVRQVERDDVFRVIAVCVVPHEREGEEHGGDEADGDTEHQWELLAVRHGRLDRQDHAEAFVTVHAHAKQERQR